MYQSKQSIDIPSVDLCSYLFDNPKYDINKPIYIDPHEPTQTLSYKDSLHCVRRLISGLKARGLQPGDSVLLHSFNSIWFSMLLIATIGARGRFVGSNPAYTTYELEHLFTITQTKFVVVEPGQLDKVASAASACGIPDTNILVFDTHGPTQLRGFVSWRTLLEHGESDWYRFDDENEAKSTPAMLASTSGTTGLPKAAVLSHHTFVLMSEQSYDSKYKTYEVKRLLCLAQFHLFPAPLMHLAPIKEGQATYIMKRWDLEQFIKFTVHYQVTETAIVTPIVLALLGLPKQESRKLTSLRYLVAAGAPLGYEDQNALRKLCHRDAIFTQVWGLTEIGWITQLHYPESDETGSVGRLMAGNEAKIIDPSGNEIVEENATGEIVVRGPGIMLGYLDNPAATSEIIRDGWLYTGDVGYQSGGKWYIVDRVKELLKVRGWQVSPSELERCLLTHPSVRDAAVIGVDFKDGRGELPRAYIVSASDDAALLSEEIMEYMGHRLAKYKALAGGIIRVQRIPRNPAGKILKRILRERAAKELRGEDVSEDAETFAAADKFAVQMIKENKRLAVQIAG